MDVTVYLPDEIGRSAKAAGLNLSGILRRGVEHELDRQGILPLSAPNLVVRRRLEFLPDDARREAAERFSAGASLSKLVEDYADRVPDGGKPLTRTRLAYCLRQELVEAGKVARIDPTDAAAIDAAFDEDGTDAAWIACRTGLTPDAVRMACGR